MIDILKIIELAGNNPDVAVSVREDHILFNFLWPDMDGVFAVKIKRKAVYGSFVNRGVAFSAKQCRADKLKQ